MIVRKAEPILVECVVRGYITGSGWSEYRQSGSVCGIVLPEGLIESQMLPDPIFTPTTKAETGHDMPMTFEEVIDLIGEETANVVKLRSLALYRYAAGVAEERGIIIADTKFEFGVIDGEITLIDEALTRRTPRASGRWTATRPATGSPRSTSSTSATGRATPAGTASRRRPSCHPRSSRRARSATRRRTG